MDYILKPTAWNSLEDNIRHLALKPRKQFKIDEFMEEYDQIFSILKKEELSDSLKKLIRYVKSNYDHEISLSDIYISILRLQKSIELLLDDERLTVREIAAQVGYHSERQLFRIFKNKLNMTPAQLSQRYY